MLKIKPGILIYLKYLYPYTLLALYLPLKFIPKAIYNKAAGIGSFEFIILAVIIIAPLIKLGRFSLTLSNNEIIFKEGLFVTRTRRVKNLNLAVISIERGIFARMLGSAKIKVYSPAGTTSKPIINAYISRRSANMLQRTLIRRETRTVKRFKLGKIILFCLGNSSFVAGVFVAAPFINRILTLTGRSITEIIFEFLGSEAQNISAVISMAIKAPLIILVLGYAFDFFKTFADMFSFKLTESESHLSLKRGFIKVHTAFIPKESVCAIVCRQTPIFSAFKRKSVAILSNGYGRQISDNDCIIPLINELEHPCVTQGLRVLITPLKKARLRPIKPYLIFMVITLLATAGTQLILPDFEILQIMLLGTFLYLGAAVAIRYKNYNRCFFILGQTISVKAQHRLSLSEIHLPKRNTAAIKITQNVFDKKYGVCKVRVFAAHKRAVSVKIKNLPLNLVVNSVGHFFADD